MGSLLGRGFQYLRLRVRLPRHADCMAVAAALSNHSGLFALLGEDVSGAAEGCSLEGRRRICRSCEPMRDCDFQPCAAHLLGLRLGLGLGLGLW